MITNKDKFIKMREDEILNAEKEQHEKLIYLKNSKKQENGKNVKSKKPEVPKGI